MTHAGGGGPATYSGNSGCRKQWRVCSRCVVGGGGHGTCVLAAVEVVLSMLEVVKGMRRVVEVVEGLMLEVVLGVEGMLGVEEKVQVMVSMLGVLEGMRGVRCKWRDL